MNEAQRTIVFWLLLLLALPMGGLVVDKNVGGVGVEGYVVLGIVAALFVAGAFYVRAGGEGKPKQ